MQEVYCPGAESVSVYTYNGNDRIDASSYTGSITRGDVIIEGGSGNDWIKGTDGADELRGGAGHDRIWGLSGADTIYGEAGNDKIEGGLGRDTIYGGNGNDHIFGDPYMEPPDNYLYPIFPADYYSRYQNDVWVEDDTIRGNDGNDCILSALGFDTIEGGNGNDPISFVFGDAKGGNGDDRISSYCSVGGSTRGYLSADTRNNSEGNRGNDRLSDSPLLQPCSETLSGNEGNDFVTSYYGRAAYDSENTTTSNRPSGGSGDDLLMGIDDEESGDFERIDTD